MSIQMTRLASSLTKSNKIKRSKTRRRFNRLKSSSKTQERMRQRISKRRIPPRSPKMKSWMSLRSKKISKTQCKTTRTSQTQRKIRISNKKRNTRWRLTPSQLSWKLLRLMTSSIIPRRKLIIDKTMIFGEMMKKSIRKLSLSSVGSKARLVQQLQASVSSSESCWSHSSANSYKVITGQASALT